MRPARKIKHPWACPHAWARGACGAARPECVASPEHASTPCATGIDLQDCTRSRAGQTRAGAMNFAIPPRPRSMARRTPCRQTGMARRTRRARNTRPDFSPGTAGGSSTPDGEHHIVRITRILASICSITSPVRFHIGPQQSVHSRLIARTLRLEPLDDVGIDAKRQQCLLGHGLQPLARHSASEHLWSPLRCIAISNHGRISRSPYAAQVSL